MKIGDLNQHCGECDVMEFCGEAWGYCLCRDLRFKGVEEEDYKKIAERTPNIKVYEDCEGCTRPDCDVYKCSKTDYADEPCEHRDLSRDYFCEQVADFAEIALKEAHP